MITGTTNIKKLADVSVDFNGDKKADRWVIIDKNGDGIVDNRIDVNGDGQIDNFIAVDKDMNGIIDSFSALDLNQDGIDDVIGVDRNGDNLIDSLSPQPNNGVNNNQSYNKSIIDQIAELTKNTTDIGQKTAIEQAQAAYINALIEAESTKKLFQMNNQSTQANAILDQQKLALQNNYNVLAKQVEMYTMDAQQKEQYTNLFFNLQFTMAQNAFQLSKTVVNAAKY
jgi:hypothetical protein